MRLGSVASADAWIAGPQSAGTLRGALKNLARSRVELLIVSKGEYPSYLLYFDQDYRLWPGRALALNPLVGKDNAMRVMVMGTGGVGGYFGARLLQGGCDVKFVARGEQLAALRERGLKVE